MPIVKFLPWIIIIHWRRKWQPTPRSCLGNPTDRGAWQATVHTVAKSRTWLSYWACVIIQILLLVLLYGKMEKAMVPHSSTLAWKIPWTEEPGGLQSMESLRVGHNWATSLHFSLSCIGEGNGNPLQYSCLENPGTEEPSGLPSMGSHRVGHDWSDAAAAPAAAAAYGKNLRSAIAVVSVSLPQNLMFVKWG